MLCPTDPFNRQSLFAGRHATEGDNWARGNYGANGALGFLTVAGTNPAGGADTPYWKNPQTRGVMGMNIALSIAKITDGTSQTILIGELRAGVSEFDPRGTWALGAAGASSLWGHGTDNAIGPNACIPGGDGIFGCGRIKGSVGGEEALMSRMHAVRRRRRTGDRPQYARGWGLTSVLWTVQSISSAISLTRAPNGTLILWNTTPGSGCARLATSKLWINPNIDSSVFDGGPFLSGSAI